MKIRHNATGRTSEKVLRMQVYVLSPGYTRSRYVDFHLPEHVEKGMAERGILLVSDCQSGVLDTVQNLIGAYVSADPLAPPIKGFDLPFDLLGKP